MPAPMIILLFLVSLKPEGEPRSTFYYHLKGMKRADMFSSAYFTIAPAIFLPISVFRRFVYAHLPRDCAEPVSYTHLDVYKRQEHGYSQADLLKYVIGYSMNRQKNLCQDGTWLI